MSRRFSMGRSVAENFLQDRLLFYYLILQITGAVLSVGIAMIPQDGVVDGISLIMATFLPPIEVYLVATMRNRRDEKGLSRWGMYYLVFFAVMGMTTLISAMALGIMHFAPEEGMEPVRLMDVLAVVGMVVSSAYYCLMGIGARQLSKMMGNKEVNHSVLMAVAVLILLVNVDSLWQLGSSLFSLTAITISDILGVLNVALAVTARMLLAVLFYRAHGEWAEVAAFRH